MGECVMENKKRLRNIQDLENKIINADCLDILKQLPDNSVDLVLTDPPYLMDNHGGVVHTGSFKRKLTNEKHINFICDDFDYWKSSCKRLEEHKKQLNLF